MILKGFILGVLITATTTVFSSIIREPFEDGMIVAEWDLTFPDMESYQEYMKTERSHHAHNKLIVGTLRNKSTMDIWDRTTRQKLTYCISNEFGTRKKDVVEAMKIATRDWMDAANVKFIYLFREDASCHNKNNKVVFDIRPINLGRYLARAFFPSYVRAQRNIIIDASSFKHSFVAFTGFLRHELGHVLGFRHEHISGQSIGRCPEDTNFKPLTAYDKLSVMHYPQCGGNNDISNLILSEMDKIGVARVYR